MVEDSNAGMLRKLLWCIPVLLTLHNIEEAVTMPAWMELHTGMLRERFWFFSHLTFSTAQLYISLMFVTLIPWCVIWYCVTGNLSQKKISFALLLQSIIGWNSLIPHGAGSILLGMYNPGVVTGLIVNLPFTVYLFRYVIQKNILQKSVTVKIILSGGIIYLPLVTLNHLLAQTLAAIFYRS